MRVRWMFRFWAVLAVALAAGAIACFLPDNAYQRWQLLDGTIHARARWIYERCNFDPTPIDVAVIGPSRTGQGVDAPRLARALASGGVSANVVNFSLPEAGRNMNWVVAEQLFQSHHPKIVILGVTEKPSRFGHPAFKFIAPNMEIIDPGYVSDADYFPDLIYLPFRQLYLFAADVAPGLFHLTKTFDRSRYPGPSIDTTGSVVLPDGSIKEGERPASARELARGVGKLEHGTHTPILPARYADVEFGDERHYVEKIARLAQAHGAKVAFLFLPYYTGPSGIQEQKFYERYGPVWNAGYLSQHAEWYADYGHLTRTGADGLTDWLARRVGESLTPKRPA